MTVYVNNCVYVFVLFLDQSSKMYASVKLYECFDLHSLVGFQCYERTILWGRGDGTDEAMQWSRLSARLPTRLQHRWRHVQLHVRDLVRIDRSITQTNNFDNNRFNHKRYCSVYLLFATRLWWNYSWNLLLRYTDYKDYSHLCIYALVVVVS